MDAVRPERQIIAVAYDGSGNIIAATANIMVGSPSHVTKISSTGVTLWTRALMEQALATGPSDTNYVLSTTSVMKIDSSSGDIWSQPLDANSSGTCGAVTPEQLHGCR